MIVLIPLTIIDDNPFQTRAAYNDEAIGELADSIRGLREARPETRGLIHVPPARVVDALDPGVVVPPGAALARGRESLETYRVQVAAGHSRLRAFRRLAADDPELWGEMPLDLGVLDDQAMADVAWSENQKRRDLSAVEEARALRAAMDRFGWTQEQVAGRWGLARPTVANKLRLLDLPGEIQQKVVAGEIGERVARSLLPALDVRDAMTAGLRAIRDNGSTEYVEQSVARELRMASTDLGDGPWPVDWPGPRQGLDVPACQGCDKRRKVEGNWRCFDKGCYEKKGAAWNKAQVTLAIRAEQPTCGTKLVTYGRQEYSSQAFQHEHELKVFEQTCRPACVHGRLGLTANVQSYVRSRHGSVKAAAGEAWFMCDKPHCFSKLTAADRGESDWQRESREAEERVRATISQLLDQAVVEIDGAAPRLLFGCEELRTKLLGLLLQNVHDDKLKRAVKKSAGRWDPGTDTGFWRTVALWWLAESVGSVWSSTDVDGTLGKRLAQLRAHLRPPEAGGDPSYAQAAAELAAMQADVQARLVAAEVSVSAETTDVHFEMAVEIADNDAVDSARRPVPCCICGATDNPLALSLLDPDVFPASTAAICETCLRDNPAGGQALGLDGLPAAARFVMDQGEWKIDEQYLGVRCLLCGGRGRHAAGWALRDSDDWRQRMQLCPECVTAGRAYRATAWSPNGKNPNLSHHWTDDGAGRWLSACGQVQGDGWQPGAEAGKRCLSCERATSH